MPGSQSRFTSIIQAHIFISGYVQGVGFRAFLKDEAVRFGVKGWVRNTRDGRVEAVLAGGKEQVEGVLAQAKEGPILATVDALEVSWETVVSIPASFVIVHE